MIVQYTNGTPRQRMLVEEAILRSTFDWDRVSLTVQFSWMEEPPYQGTEEFAACAVYWDGWQDSCGRPIFAEVFMRTNLDDPGRPQPDGAPPGYYAGDAFYREVVIHELAHVWQAMLTESQKLAIVAMFASAWTGPEPLEWITADSGPETWGKQVIEACAEFFKDVYLPRRERKFDNHTLLYFPREQYTAFLDIVDAVCPCPVTPS